MDQQFGQPNQGEQQNQAYQPQQQPPQYQYEYGGADANKPMTVGQYLVMMLIGIIPIAGIIMWFVWAFGSNVNTNKRNFARAYLIMMLIGLGLSIIFFIAFSAAIAGMMSNMGGYGY